MKDWELRQKQSLPLEQKIVLTEKRIEEFYDYFAGNVYVSFSGGKDSTVLLNLVRNLYPEVPAVFVNTGLEYPEIVDFVSTFKNIIVLRPEMSFKKVLEYYGFPIVSKIVAKQIRVIKNPTNRNSATRNLYLTGIKKDGSKSPYFKLAEKWKFLLNEDIKISEKCCDIMKKAPLNKFSKETKRQGFNGTMASDSRNRLFSYLKTGCNSFDGGWGASRPLGFWKTSDIWEYIKEKKISYCSVYDTGIKTTGCIFCMFGCHLEKEPNRFQLMKKSHPALHSYCINKLNLRKPLELLGIPWE